MKTKKNVLIILMLLLVLILTGCEKTKTNIIVVPKVDIVDNYQSEKCILDLNIYTSVDINDMKLVLDNDPLIYHNQFEIKLNMGKTKKTGLLHQFKIIFTTGEINIQKIGLMYDNKTLSYDIGRYICSEYENSHSGINMHGYLENDVLISSVSNETYETIVIEEIKSVYSTYSHTISFPVYSENYLTITNNEILFLKSLKIQVDENVEQLSNILRYDFKTSKGKEYAYLKYYLDKRPNLNYLREEGYKMPQT